MAAHRWSPVIGVSSSQFMGENDDEDDDDDGEDELADEETVAEVEALLADEDVNRQGAGEEGPEVEPLQVQADPDVEPVEDQAGTAEAVPTEAAMMSPPATSQYILNFLWLDRNVAVAVDQFFSKAEAPNEKSPVTEYYFWPRNDAWEELKSCLESKPWISDRDKILLLNRTTEVINFWQDEETKHTIDEAKEKFPDCSFSGA